MRNIPGTLAVAALVAWTASTATAQEHESCPMHKAHMARSAVDHRHEDTTGLPSHGIEHHFLLSADGGSIRLEVKDAKQAEDRARVRAHLQAIARAFAAGDFAMPVHIHDQVPPGVETMKARKDAIRYRYAETPKGGAVAIATADPAALGAIHDFLRFQISDHATGDPIR
jgi:hypothetical protein